MPRVIPELVYVDLPMRYIKLGITHDNLLLLLLFFYKLNDSQYNKVFRKKAQRHFYFLLRGAHLPPPIFSKTA